MDKEPRSNLWIAWMETLDGLGYITAGLSFLVLGVVVAGPGVRAGALARKAGQPGRLRGKRNGRQKPGGTGLRRCCEGAVAGGRGLREGHQAVRAGRVLNRDDAGGREHDGVELEFP